MDILALIRSDQMIICAAQMLGMNPLMPWDNLEQVTLYLRLDQRGQDCPSFEQLLQFLRMVPYEHSRQLFMAVRFLMETMTNQTIPKGMVPFGMVMESFVQREDRCRRRRYVEDDFPPPIPGIPNSSYSCDLWRLVKQVYQFQSSLRPVTLPNVLSSRNMMVASFSQCDMMTSSTAQVGFRFRCVMHGSNPRLKLVTVSPGMFCVFVRKFLGQNSRQIRWILARYYCLNRRMLQNI